MVSSCTHSRMLHARRGLPGILNWPSSQQHTSHLSGPSGAKIQTRTHHRLSAGHALHASTIRLLAQAESLSSCVYLDAASLALAPCSRNNKHQLAHMCVALKVMSAADEMSSPRTLLLIKIFSKMPSKFFNRACVAATFPPKLFNTL